MPPKRSEDAQTLKEKLHSLQGSNGRRRNGAANLTNGSNLKEVMSSTADNASTNSGQNDHNSSGMKWSSQEASVLHGYRRAYHLDTPSAFKNPLSHVVLNQGVGRFSPTMARPKTKRRVQKDNLALAVRKNFNALAVSESDVIVDLLYKAKNQAQIKNFVFALRRSESNEGRVLYTSSQHTSSSSRRYPGFGMNPTATIS